MSRLGVLVVTDLVQQRAQLLFSAALAAIFALLSALPTMGLAPLAGVLAGLPVVVALRAAYQDEEAHGLLFQRSLPVAPAVVVAGRFLSVATAQITNLFVAQAALAALGGTRGAVQAQIFVADCAGLVLAGVMLANFYRYGYRLLYTVFVGLIIAATLVAVMGGWFLSGEMASWLSRWAGLAWLGWW